MNVRSLGYLTDLIFPRFDGQIIDRGRYLVIRTPVNPTFHWGNFLLFSNPPRPGDEVRWPDLFGREIGTPPSVRHQAFGWDSPEGDIGETGPFRRLGFEVEVDIVLTADHLHPPPRPAAGITIRTLDSDADWKEAVELNVATGGPRRPEADRRELHSRLMVRYRRMAAAGRGDWYGAFVEGRLVAGLGLYHEAGLGRYQSVITYPDFRGRGIASTLVYEAGRQSISRYGLHTLVIVAEEAAGTSSLYESVGFIPREKSVGMEWSEHVIAAPSAHPD